MNFKNLDTDVRNFMLSEIKDDINSNKLYFSKYFNTTGINLYPNLLQTAAKSGNSETLANSILEKNCVKEKAQRKTKSGGKSMVKVPKTAHETLAQGEFNRFYMRAVCRKAIEENKEIEIYRGRHSNKPRSASIMLIGKKIDPKKMLADLRTSIGVDTALGLPPGPNSGLTIKLV
jgi:hypothetical protein